MKTIDEDIKQGTFRNVYLLYGEEAYLLKQYKDKLVKAMVAENDNMNFATFTGKDVSVKEIIDLSETLPFFAERRVILIEDSGFFKNAQEELATYMGEIP
ncbi:MAG: DNA polymerase III subunit delta, partial [Agathobacter sp.]|nr:DNA polymerase III subunit delta [Agathobacter sp.]